MIRRSILAAALAVAAFPAGCTGPLSPNPHVQALAVPGKLTIAGTFKGTIKKRRGASRGRAASSLPSSKAAAKSRVLRPYVR